MNHVGAALSKPQATIASADQEQGENNAVEGLGKISVHDSCLSHTVKTEKDKKKERNPKTNNEVCEKKKENGSFISLLEF